MLQVIAGTTVDIPYVAVEPDGTPAAAATLTIRRMDTGAYWDDDAPGGAAWVVDAETNAMSAGGSSGNFWYAWAVGATLTRGTRVRIECAATDCIPISHSVTCLGALVSQLGDEMDLVDAPNGTAITAIQDGLSVFDPAEDPVDIGAVAGTEVTDIDEFKADVSGIPAAVDVTLSASHGSGTWEVSSGSGAFPITLTVVDDSAVPVAGAKVRFQVTGGFAIQITNSSGQVSFNSDAGSWLCYVGTSASYIPATSYTVVVSGAGVVTSGNIVVTEVTIPASGSSSVTLYSDEYDPYGNALVGAGDRTAYVVVMLSGSKFVPSDKLHYHALSDKGTGSATNSSGRWTMELPIGVSLIIKIVDATTGKSEAWKVTTPDAAGAYSLWELGPEEVTLVL